MIGPPVLDAKLRHVCKLRLAVGSAQAQQRALRVLEESLGLISLPGEGAGKVFYFRRLRLPALRPDENANYYANLIEQKCREMARGAVHFSDAAADHADAAFAWSPVEPWQELAWRMVRARPLQGWFWRALPEAKRGTEVRTPLEVLFAVAALYGKEGLLEFLGEARPEVLRTILGKLEVAHLQQGKLPAWYVLAHRSHSSTHSQIGRKLLDRLPALWRQLATEYAAHWKNQEDEPDLRVRWLVATAWLLAEPERAMDPRLPEQIDVMAEALVEEAEQPVVQIRGPEQRHDSTVEPSYSAREAEPNDVGPHKGLVFNQADSKSGKPTGHARLRSSAEGASLSTSSFFETSANQLDPAEVERNAPGELTMHSPFTSSADRVWPAKSTSSETSTDPLERAEIREPDSPRRDIGEVRIPTAYAGFFYCLGLLDRMGIDETLSVHPELIDINFVGCLLRELALAAGADSADPAARHDLWLNARTPIPEEQNLPFSPFLLPIGWRDRSSRVPLWPLTRLLRVWLLAARRSVWRRTRMSLPELAMRPGEFTVSRTHLEIMLPQNSLDVRVRKAGFDVNPGWLPWFRRVVVFQYSCPVLEVIPVGGIRHGTPTQAVLSRLRPGRGPDEEGLP